MRRLAREPMLWRCTEAEAAEYGAIGDHDRRVAQWFGLLFLAGLVAMAWMSLVFAIPFTIGMVGWVAHSLANPTLTSVAFWESAAVTTLAVGQYAVIPLLAWRERRLRREGVLR
jgi:hypothetical protein